MNRNLILNPSPPVEKDFRYSVTHILGLTVILLIFAGVLFVQDFAEMALWGDEGWSNEASQQPTPAAVIKFAKPDIHPPLYFLSLHFWRQVVGDQFMALRTLNLWAGLLTIALTFDLGRRWFNLWAAVAAAVIVATSDLVLVFMTEIRHYTFFLFFCTLIAWCYWRFIQHWNLRWGLAYVLAALGLIYTLYWGGFVLLAHAIHALIYERDRLWRHRGLVVLLAVLLLAGYMPWLPMLYRQFAGGGVGTGDGAGYNQALTLDKMGAEIVLFQLYGVPEALFMGLAFAGIIGTYQARRWRDLLPTSATFFAATWMIIPVIVPVLMGLAGYNILTHRPLVGLIPAMALLCGHVLSQMKSWQYHLLLLVILVNNLTTVGSIPTERGDWWEVADFMEAYASPDDVIHIEADVQETFVIEAHLQLSDAAYRRIEHGADFVDNWLPETEHDLNILLNNVSSLWLINFHEDKDIRPDLAALGFVPTTPLFDFGAVFGDATDLMRYARPPSSDPVVRFEDVLDLMEAVAFVNNGQVHVDLTWQVEAAPGTDYTVSVFLLNSAGGVAQPAQHDSFPLNAHSPTSTWQPGGVYFDRHNLNITGLPAGEYQVGVKVYHWQDGAIAILPINPCDNADCTYFITGTISLP